MKYSDKFQDSFADAFGLNSTIHEQRDSCKLLILFWRIAIAIWIHYNNRYRWYNIWYFNLRLWHCQSLCEMIVDDCYHQHHRHWSDVLIWYPYRTTESLPWLSLLWSFYIFLLKFNSKSTLIETTKAIWSTLSMSDIVVLDVVAVVVIVSAVSFVLAVLHELLCITSWL